MMEPTSPIDILEETKDAIVNYIEDQNLKVEDNSSSDLIFFWKIGYNDIIACHIALYPHTSGQVMVKTCPILRDGKNGHEALLGEEEIPISTVLEVDEQIKSIIRKSKNRAFSFYKVVKNIEATLYEGGFNGVIKLGSPIKNTNELGFQYILFDKRKSNIIESIVAVSSTSRGIIVRGRSHFLNELGEVVSDTIWNKLLVKSEDPDWVLSKIYEIPQLINDACVSRGSDSMEDDPALVYKKLLREPGYYGDNVVPLIFSTR